MTAYYNEIDDFCAGQLRSLIQRGLIPDGVVDTRSIEDVTPDEIREFTQCHFFAGIGIWPLALRNAGWPDDRPVWSCSCPCQPFSAAGKGAGFADERHLWPALHWLIQQCRPPVVFGEQVANQPAWIDLVQIDLEALGYAFGCVPFPAAGVGAPHIRDRAYWVADTNHERSQRWELLPQRANQQSPGAGGMAGGFWSDCDWLPCTDGKFRPAEPGIFPLVDGDTRIVDRVGRIKAYGNALVEPAAQTFIRAYMGDLTWV